MVEVTKIMVTSFKRSHAHTSVLSASDLEAGHCQSTPPLEIPGHTWACLGQSLVVSLLLSSGFWCTQILFVPSQSLFLQSCVSSGGSKVG